MSQKSQQPLGRSPEQRRQIEEYWKNQQPMSVEEQTRRAKALHQVALKRKANGWGNPLAAEDLKIDGGGSSKHGNW